LEINLYKIGKVPAAGYFSSVKTLQEKKRNRQKSTEIIE
jgi:hypothetical protein